MKVSLLKKKVTYKHYKMTRTNLTSSIDAELKDRASNILRKQNRTWSNFIEEAINNNLLGNFENSEPEPYVEEAQVQNVTLGKENDGNWE